MIVPMKKITMLFLDSDQAQAVSTLQDMGLIHIEPLQPPESSDVAAIRARRETLAAAQAILLAWVNPQVKSSPPLPLNRLDEKINRVRALDLELRELKIQSEATRAEIARWEPFGHFDLRQIQALAHSGIRIKLLFIPGKNTPVFPDSVQATLLKKTDDGFFAAVTALDDQPLIGQEYPLPTQSLRALEAQGTQLNRRLTEIETELRTLADLLPQLDALRLDIEDQLLFEDARAGMKTAGRIACLKGYCPVDALPPLNQTAATKGWAILVEDPQESDPVPTLVRNPVWIRPIRFLFQLIGVVPGYREIDISAAFLGFYSLFFAMLVADAGYGLLLLAVTGILHWRIKTIPRDLIRLLALLAIGTIAWGVLTGSYFGIANLPAPLAQARIEWLTHEANLMKLCFLLGSIHLTLAHLWNLVRSLPQSVFLSQIGWIGLIWTLYFLACNMILGEVLPAWVLPLFWTSLGLIVLFMTPPKMLKTEWHNHLMLPLSIINAFGDVVSYVRLFAVGSAGTAISIAFNQMALGNGIHSFGSGLSAVLILFFAHTLNILLCALAVVVHGVRLNTLEFSGHLGMQWTGIEFNPFRRKAPAAAVRSGEPGPVLN